MNKMFLKLLNLHNAKRILPKDNDSKIDAPKTLGDNQPIPAPDENLIAAGLNEKALQFLATRDKNLSDGKSQEIQDQEGIKKYILKKLEQDPTSITLQDMGIVMLSRQQDLTDKSSLGTISLIKVTPKETVLSEEGKIKAIKENKILGLKHAREMRETTPVIPRDFNGISTTRIVRVEKVQLDNGEIRLQLFVDEVPWKFTPQEGTNDLTENFLMAHDIMRHFVLNRDRSINTPMPGGEYNTGQVNAEKTLLPKSPLQYDGLIANITDKILETETGSFSFKQLGIILDQFYRDSNVPIGSSLEIKFDLPPPDISWELNPEDRQKVYDELGTTVEIERIPTKKIPLEYSRITNDNRFSLSEEPFNSNDAVNAVHSLLMLPDKEEVTEKLLQQIKVEKFVETVADPFDLKETYEFISTTDGKKKTANRYYQTKDGEKITPCEAELIKQGIKPKEVSESLLGNPVRKYVVPANWGRTKLYRFLGNSGFETYVDSTDYTQYKVSYTGHPYKNAQVDDIKVILPNGKGLPENSSKRFKELFERYKSDFEQYQAKIKEILEGGALHLDVPFTLGFASRSYVDHYIELVRSGIIEKGAPVTLAGIQAGIFKRTQGYESLSLYPRQDETFFVAPFPPPPAK